PRAPVFVVDRRAIFHCNGAHVIFSLPRVTFRVGRSVGSCRAGLRVRSLAHGYLSSELLGCGKRTIGRDLPAKTRMGRSEQRQASRAPITAATNIALADSQARP